jgi:hypothetical protein
MRSWGSSVGCQIRVYDAAAVSRLGNVGRWPFCQVFSLVAIMIFGCYMIFGEASRMEIVSRMNCAEGRRVNLQCAGGVNHLPSGVRLYSV